ncbi:MAG: alanine--tRNA ligase [Nitrospirae bacterium]|uniref:alanine--tRNA ligase n=1 Tax=Candidatus Magnetobacterium casense TaxID=1455061 RepID=UPI00058E2BA6|nr:alanine--tRNA ligase [Candidatus Magnetobacterium casensis]MBF0336561.1 alanine--tRNA ligase [Nitrospirota bacterium]
MKSKEIRDSFLQYFQSREHELVKSAALLPKGDPTLLFTNAGMVQFKNYFLGADTPPYTKAVSCQKCMRAGGKQSDIENVGFTARHHTLFEMLGNFSFGDYFKRDAIVYAWELLTQWFKLPIDKLYASVYEDDDEAADLWVQHTSIAPERIRRLGAKDNFWQMGDTGPCGPCSEIIIDQGAHMGCGKPNCNVGCDCDRYLELWNLVFMQYEKDSNGTLTPLPRPSIDTGMGLERIAAVMQQKSSNFDTDIFAPIIGAISTGTGIPYGNNKRHDSSIRVVADHIRCLTFLLSEGLLPANDGRGYVLRRIIRRASRHTRVLGMDRAFLYSLVPAVIEAMGEVYSEITINSSRSQDILKSEEERFFRTLQKGSEIIDDLINSLRTSNQDVLPGGEVFRLYDTYGFPLELSVEIARENGMTVDEAGFAQEMERQKTRGKASWTEEGHGLSALMTSLYNSVAKINGETCFLGYELLESEAEVRCLLRESENVDALLVGQQGEAILDKTPFYGESGGQAGDTGIITTDDALIEVTDTKKTPNNLIIHKVVVKRGQIRLADRVVCRLNEQDRLATMKNHSATHLLHAALRNLLGEHVKQAGSLVSPTRLRFDFTHFYQLSAADKDAIEDMVNEKVMDNIGINTHLMDLKDAISYGATALFDEKYGDMVRVVEMGDFSKELCGGTHCTASGEIGPFVIVSEASIASGVRRIEALTGKQALTHIRKNTQQLHAIAQTLKTDNPLDKAVILSQHARELEKELDQLKHKAMANETSTYLSGIVEIDGVKTLVVRKDGFNQKELRDFADFLKGKLGSAIILVASTLDDQTNFLCMVAKDLTARFDAGRLLKVVLSAADGRGGGKKDMAQGGTRQNEKVNDALTKIYDAIKKEAT